MFVCSFKSLGNNLSGGCKQNVTMNRCLRNYRFFSSTTDNIQRPKSFLQNAHLDYKSIVANADAYKKEVVNRNMTADVDKVINLYTEYCSVLKEVSNNNSMRTKLSEKMKRLFSFTKHKKDKSELFSPEVTSEVKDITQEGKTYKEKGANLEKVAAQLEVELQQLALAIPNLSHPSVPIGDESKATVVRRYGGRLIPELSPTEKGELKPTPSWWKDHFQYITENNLVDFEQASKITGNKFCYLKNEVAMLELALQMWAVNRVISFVPQKGDPFTLLSTPDLVDTNVVLSCGFQPRAKNSQIYNIQGYDLSLVGTAEIPLSGFYFDKIIDPKNLPIRLLGYGHCFRAEAGGLGVKFKGLYRLHQFTKVEMYYLCTPEDSDQLLEELLSIQESLIQDLGIPYVVLDMPTEELGAPAYRKYDIEGWMPSRGYGEITSASNCTDYQSRRLSIRCKGETKNYYVHTLNATACAIPRMILSIIECFQQPDGSVKIPEVLVPFMNGKTFLTPIKSS